MIEDNSFSALPNNWVWAKTGDICEGVVPGRTKPKNFQGTIPWITLPDVPGLYVSKSQNNLAVTREDAEAVGMKVMPEGSVLMSCVGQFGLVCIAKNEIVPNQQLHGFICLDKVLPEYLAYALMTQVDQMNQLASATTVAYINKTKCNSIQIPLAPFNEQRHIVAKIEALMDRSQRVKEALEAIPSLLNQFRRSVVNAAFRGNLTTDWREKNLNVETAEELLKRVQKDEESFLEKYQELSPLQQENLPALPDKWIWTVTENLSNFESNAICAGPFGTIFKAKDFRHSGIPIIFLRHVGEGKYLTNKPGFMDVEKWEELFKPYSVWGGELLVTKLGEPPGVCAIYPEGIGPAMVTPDVIKMSVNKYAAETPYLMYYLNSDLSKRFAFGIAYGMTRLRMNLPIFRTLPVPLAPLQEQREIVRRIQSFFKAADRLEQQYQEARVYLDQLDQSILAKAFRGELVPQDPNDEPASVLLERIRAERVKREAEAKVAKKFTGKTSGQRDRKAKQQDLESIQLGLPGLE